MRRSLEIEVSSNGGAIIRAGCKTLVFADRNEALKEIGRYWDNPDAVEKEYAAKYWPKEPRLEPVPDAPEAETIQEERASR